MKCKILKTIVVLLTIAIIFAIVPFGSFVVNAASYTSDWQRWSQGASDDANVRAYGCWVVAQARLIKMLGINNSSTFNPDVYLKWEQSTGHINSGYYQVNGDVAPVNYAKSMGHNLAYKGISYNSADVWNSINNGYYGIICVSTSSSPTGSHWMLLDNDRSKSTGTICCYDSWSTKSVSRSVTLSEMSYKFYSIYMYSYNSNPHPGKPSLSVVASSESKMTGFTWNSTANTDHYDLRIWRSSDNANIVTVYDIRRLNYSYSLPAGKYTANICSVDEKINYTFSDTVSFTVTATNFDYQPSAVAVCGDKIFAVFDNLVSYDNAKSVCKTMGGHIASIHNAKEQESVRSLLSSSAASYWLGATDIEKEGVWKWEDGTQWNYSNWAPGEPNNSTSNGNGENHLEIDTKTGLWNDLTQRYNLPLGFVAEFYIDEIAFSQSADIVRKEYNSNLHQYVPVSKYILFDKGVPWEVAEAYCESLGGYLATITSADENDTILSIISNGKYLIGLTDKYNEGTWKWINGEEFIYSKWESGEPNDYSQGEDYGSITKYGWNDRPNIVPTGFICEIDITYTSGDLTGDEKVTDADAIYLLMYTFFPEDYPISQPCDYDGDGKVTDADAIYLLMYTFFPDDYPIQ